MQDKLTILKKNRKLILKLIEGFNMSQLNKIPDGFNNNIVWNVAHLAVTQQLLCYEFSNLPMYVSVEIIEKYRKGSVPMGEITIEEFEEIKELFINLPIQFEEDYSNKIFKEYQEYTTSINVTVHDIDSAISFNDFHEGIHLGQILALRKLI